MIKTVIFWPAIAQFALIALCYIHLGRVRMRSIRDGVVNTTDFAPGEEPKASAEARRHLANQFELPVLFFVAIAFLFAISGVSILELALAWAFVVFRVLHTVGSLNGPLSLRHAAFFVSFLLVVALWVDLAVRIL